MATSVVPTEFMDLLTGPVVALLATTSRSCVPYVSPIWIEYADDHLFFSSQDRTLKRRNVAANPNVSLCLLDPGDPYRYMELRGVVTKMTVEGAHEHLDKLSQRYRGEAVFPGHDYSVPRTLMKMRIDKVIVQPVSPDGP